MSEGEYFFYSELPGNLNLGLERSSAKKDQAGGRAAASGQFVILGGELVKWHSIPKIVGDSPTLLGVGPYKYTGEFNGEVFASNDEYLSQEWFIVFDTDRKRFRVLADSIGRYVWTAGKKGEPIAIKPATLDDDNQWFIYKSA